MKRCEKKNKFELEIHHVVSFGVEDFIFEMSIREKIS